MATIAGAIAGNVVDAESGFSYRGQMENIAETLVANGHTVKANGYQK